MSAEMDDEARLGLARNMKDQGNDCFRKGKLLEAQKVYTEVLDILRREMTFTQDDKKKEKESLLLTVHLNLAECALREGDNARVIDHCNSALDINSNSIKAHFRKAKAFQNQAEYAQALQSYQDVLKLEPGQSLAQRLLSECRARLDSKRYLEPDSKTSRIVAKGETDNTEYHDVEIVYEQQEESSNFNYRNCKKNPGHKLFIDVNDFKMSHLPSAYQNQELFDLFKLQIQITVCIKVKGNSEHRPDFYPGTNHCYPTSGKRYRKLTRCGSGWVEFVIPNKEGELCPCPTCQSSAMPKKRWAYIYIRTATHVVFDEIEGNQTTCYFFYDAEDDDIRSCPSISNAGEVSSSLNSDDCSLQFITHDVEFIDQLHKIWADHFLLVMKIRQKYNADDVSESNQVMIDMFSQLQQRFSELIVARRQQLDTMKAILLGNPIIELKKYFEKRKYEGANKLDSLGHLLLDKFNGGDKYKYILEEMSAHVETCCSLQTTFGQTIAHDKRLALLKTERGRQEVLKEYAMDQFVVKSLEKSVNFTRRLLYEDDKDGSTPRSSKPAYNKAHPLTVITSHPHGSNKKITIGEVTDRTSSQYEYFSQYTYSNATCPGSSGALVFILGQGVGCTDHPHSRFGSDDPLGGGQRNQSGIVSDL